MTRKNSQTDQGYKDDSLLKKRKSLYDFVVPRIDLEKEIYSLIDLPDTKTILDEGCGNGDLLIRLRKEYQYKGSLFGIDISEGILQPGIEQNRKEMLGIDFRVGDAEKLGFEADYFDVIIAKHVLQLVPDPKSAIAEAYRCLKQGGIYIIVLNSKDEKPKVRQFLQSAAEQLGSQVSYAHTRLNIENLRPCLSGFSEITSKKYDTETQLTDPEPYLSYFDTRKLSLTTLPDEAAWKKILDSVRAAVSEEIKKEGKFREHNSFGIYVARK